MFTVPNLSSEAPLNTGRRTRFAAIAWVSSIQFFIAQAVVQSAWKTPFSLTANYISDLGNTVCGSYPVGSEMYVCSPWHAVMNASFLLMGVTVPLGAVLAGDALRSAGARCGLVMIAVGGLGFVLVGLFPENVNIAPHRLGAGLQFVSGNLGQAVVGFSLLRTRSWRGPAVFSIASGLLGLLASALLVTGHYLGLGIGGMERLAAYALPIWTIVIGVALGRQTGS